MSFDLFWRILWVALLGALFVYALRDLRRGRSRFGGAVYSRDAQPVEYWFSVLLPLLFSPLLLLALFLPGEPLPLAYLSNIMIATIPAFWVVRALQTGRAGVAQVEFERALGPREYWLILGFTAAGAALMAGLGLLGLLTTA